MAPRKNSVLALCAGFIALTGLDASAQDQGYSNVINNMAHEAIECAAYFAIVAVGLDSTNKPEAADRYEMASDNLLQWAAVLTEEAGLKPETLTARLDLALQDQRDQIDDNTSNISILIAQYADTCVAVSNDPDSRAEYWMERELNSGAN